MALAMNDESSSFKMTRIKIHDSIRMTTAVKKTSKFFVLDSTTALSSRSLNTEGSADALLTTKSADIVSISTGKRVTVDETSKVACFKSFIQIEDALLDKIDSEQSKKKGVSLMYSADSIPASPTTPAVKEQYYPLQLCRAGLFYRLVSLCQGRSGVRTVVIRSIASMLNADVIPSFTSEELAGSQLVKSLSGVGSSSCFMNGIIVDTADAFQNSGLSTISLTVDEAKTLSSEKFLFTGSASLLANAAINFAQTIDCVSSISCESFGALTEPFDAIHFEMNRQHRGQMTSASNLRILLEGSKRTNSPNSSELISNLAFQKLPQVNGAILESFTIIAKSLEIELNSGESGPIEGNQSTRFEPVPALLSLETLSSGLLYLSTSSRERLQTMRKDSLILPSNVSESPDRVLNVYSLIQRLTMDLATELREATSNLNAIDQEAVNTQKLKEVSLDASSKPGSGTGKPEVDDSNLTPEQRAKAEAKRKAKADKAAAKAADKNSKKGGTGASGVVLGVGTAQLRTFFTTACPNTLLEEFQRALNPFDSYENSFIQFCRTLLEQLNSGGKRKPKIAKGTRDYTPEQMRIREQAFAAIKRVFKRHGGVEIDTPVFELKEVLTGKYGEDSKLIYDLADQGGELLSLRYDLTVPFARFLAMNSVGNIKRYHIAKVYRRDQPQLNRGRYREFYQCDFDIAGSYIPMIPDAEVITVAVEILSELPVGPFLIKLNHRKILDAIFEICGVPAEKFRPICSAVDKLDKMPWDEVRKEMVVDKGLAEDSADRIGTFVCRHGHPKELWQQFQDEKIFGDHAGANAAMADLKLLFDYLDAMGSLSSVSFDMSLARGLDYYTGVIYEAILTDGTSQVGSIAAGGRYDNLVGMFSTSGTQTPCVGVSIGIERVFTIMEKKAEELKLMQSSTIQVYVASIGANLIPDRMKVAKLLWDANISAEFSRHENPKFKKQLDEVLERGIPYIVVFGEDELVKGTVKVKNMILHTEVEVAVSELVNTMLADGCVPVPPGADLQFLTAMKSAETMSRQK